MDGARRHVRFQRRVHEPYSRRPSSPAHRQRRELLLTEPQIKTTNLNLNIFFSDIWFRYTRNLAELWFTRMPYTALCPSQLASINDIWELGGFWTPRNRNLSSASRNNSAQSSRPRSLAFSMAIIPKSDALWHMVSTSTAECGGKSLQWMGNWPHFLFQSRWKDIGLW